MSPHSSTTSNAGMLSLMFGFIAVVGICLFVPLTFAFIPALFFGYKGLTTPGLGGEERFAALVGICFGLTAGAVSAVIVVTFLSVIALWVFALAASIAGSTL